MITLFWDHQRQNWVPKKLDLLKVPLKYRCPTCGKILVKPQDRDFIDQYPQWAGLDLIGGVCKECWLDGKGTHGNSLLARMLRKELQIKDQRGNFHGEREIYRSQQL